MKSLKNQLFLVNLGKRIVELRKKKGLSQRELCLRMDWDKPNLSVIENGKTSPSITSIKKIAEALEIPLKDLFNFEY